MQSHKRCAVPAGYRSTLQSRCGGSTDYAVLGCNSAPPSVAGIQHCRASSASDFSWRIHPSHVSLCIALMTCHIGVLIWAQYDG